MMTFPIYGKMKNVATNQYVFLCFDVTLASKYGDAWHGHRKKLEFQEQNVDSKQQELG